MITMFAWFGSKGNSSGTNMYLRLLLLIGILSTRVLLPFALIILPALVVAWSAGFWLYRKAPSVDAPAPPGNPIALLPAFGFVIFVAFAAVAAKWAAGRFGEQGIALLLLIVGSTDVDTAIITLGGLPPVAISPLLAAIAIGGTVIVNMDPDGSGTSVDQLERGFSIDPNGNS